MRSYVAVLLCIAFVLGCEHASSGAASAESPASPVSVPPPVQIGPTDEQIIGAVIERARHGRFPRTARLDSDVVERDLAVRQDRAVATLSQHRVAKDPATRRIDVRAAIAITAKYGRFMGPMNTPGCPAPDTTRFGFDFIVSENPVAVGEYVAKTVRMDSGTQDGH